MRLLRSDDAATDDMPAKLMPAPIFLTRGISDSYFLFPRNSSYITRVNS
jgi:hypothetical protein